MDINLFEYFANWIQSGGSIPLMLKLLIAISLTMLLFFVAGLLLAFLIWAPGLRRLRLAQEDNLMLTGRLNEIVEDQNILLSSLNRVRGEEREKWSSQIARREDRLELLACRIAELDADSSAIKSILESKDEKISFLESKLGSQVTEEDRLQSDIEKKDRVIEGLKRDLSPNGALAKRVRELESLLSDRENDLQKETGQQKEKLAEQSDENNRLREQIAEFGDAAKRIEELEKTVSERESETAGLQERIEGMNRESDEREKNWREQVENRDREIATLRDRLMELETRVPAEEMERVAAQKSDLEKFLEEQLDVVEQLEEEKAALTAELSQREADLRDLREKFEREKFDEELKPVRLEVNPTHTELSHSQPVDGESIRSGLGLDSNEFRERIDEEAEESMPSIEAFRDEPVKLDERLGIVYTTPPPTIDDLTRIKGVGKVLEKELHSFGIYRFKQVGLWTQPVIHEFASTLPFGFRVTKEQWVSQAKDLHLETYGESV